jgi:hypothetical protein
MQRASSFFLNVIFFLHALLLFFLLFENRIVLPGWLQVVGRLHPAMLHVPIGLLIFLFLMLLARNEFKAKPFRRLMLMLLTLTSLTASITALFGFFLSLQNGYNPDAVIQHKITGITLSFLCYVILIVYDRSEGMTPLFYILSVLVLGFMFVTGHSGGTLTHGENFVLAPILKEPKKEHLADASVYGSVVFPILEKKCTSCHNPAKAKGKLVMTSVADFKRGGKSGKEWVAGKPAESRLIKYLHLPLADEHHMPPDGKPQLTAAEIKLLEKWILGGSDFEVTLPQLHLGDSLRIVAEAFVIEKTRNAAGPDYDFPFAPAAVVEKLNTPLRAVFPLYRESPALQADFFVQESFETGSLAELEEVKEQLVVLNLSKMPVTDQALSTIGKFRHLEKLNLNFSNVSGSGLASLQSLDRLALISLAGTNVEAKSLKPVLDLPSLREIYIWNTKVTEKEKTDLQKQYPQIAIVTTQFKNDKVLRLGKPGLVNEGIIRRDELVELRHSMPGVEILYTLDGTNPDSLKSAVYTEPIKLMSTAKIKAVACREGWFCSELFEMTCFLDGYKPEQTELLSDTDSYYRGEGAKSLTDKEIGFIEVLNAPPWLGYKDRPFVAGFDFGSNPPEISSLVLSYADSPGGTYFPPESVEVWGGSDKKNVKLIKSFKPQMPVKGRAQQVEALYLPLPTSHHPYYKIVAKPVAKLPSWHDAKGKKGWLLVDEVLFY